MKEYTVTQVYASVRDFQHIRAKSRDEAIEIARDMDTDEDSVDASYRETWFAEVEEEE